MEIETCPCGRMWPNLFSRYVERLDEALPVPPLARNYRRLREDVNIGQNR